MLAEITWLQKQTFTDRAMHVSKCMLLQEAKTAVETAIEQAKETCDSGTTQECAAAWDEVCSSGANRDSKAF